MSLIIYDLFGGRRDKVQRAVELVRSFEPPDKYYLAYSGGKDSIVVEAILRMAGVGYEIHEAPSVSKKGEMVLKEGMVFTIEPGVYIEGDLGIRIEDTVLLTATGCEVITI